jgi:NADH-quinone oxidoreductase subunit J
LAILVILIFAALWTVMARSLLRSAIGLALVSALLTMVMFRLNSPLAAVFELSVCAGLISVLFVSVISLTQPLSQKEIIEHMKAKLSRFWLLPFLVVTLGIMLSLISVKLNINAPAPEREGDVRFVLWYLRQFDLLGQIIILLAGVFGVVILFREPKKNG